MGVALAQQDKCVARIRRSSSRFVNVLLRVCFDNVFCLISHSLSANDICAKGAAAIGELLKHNKALTLIS